MKEQQMPSKPSISKTQSGTNSVNPTDFDTQTYPLWNSDVRNRQYIPPLL
jgi:hypothetical protein